MIMNVATTNNFLCNYKGESFFPSPCAEKVNEKLFLSRLSAKKCLILMMRHLFPTIKLAQID